MRAAIRPAVLLPHVRPAAWAALLVCALPAPAWSRPPGVTPPAPARKPAPASPAPEAAAPSPGQSAKPQPAPKPDLVPIPLAPAEGPLGRHELIQLAIQSHPDFWRFRGEVAYYLQAEDAAYDWRDPELRVGYDHEFEQDLSRTFEESSTINTTESGFFDSTSTTTFTGTDPNGDLIAPGATSQRESVSQSRKITTETVRRVTPGKYQDIIDETVYEVERRNESRRQNERGPGAATENSRTNEYSRRRVLSRSREYRNHPNDVYGDDQFVIQGRFFIPNPWEMKARAARARAEASLSDKRLKTEVRNLVFDVGRRYDELQFRHAWHQANLRLLDLMQRNLTTLEKEAEATSATAAAAAAAGITLFDELEIPRARLEISKAREEVFDSGRELALVREELGLLCGLDDPSRILLTNSLRLRKLSEAQLDTAALVELARAHRPDLGEMKARSDIERARLREIKALRLPWITDLRVGYAQTTADGYRDQDELTALLSINLPLFSWWQNKSHRQHEEAIANFEAAEAALGERVQSQVAFAVRAVHAASAALADFSKSEQLLRSDLKKNEADAAATTPDKAARIRLSSEETEIKAGRGRLQALYHYNQAVAHLELALGLPIEEAFAAPAAKAPVSK